MPRLRDSIRWAHYLCFYANGTDDAKLLTEQGKGALKKTIGSHNTRKLLFPLRRWTRSYVLRKGGVRRAGVIKAAKGGGVLTIVLFSAYRVTGHVLTENATLSRLIGTLASDVVKVGIGTGDSIVGAAALGIARGASIYVQDFPIQPLESVDGRLLSVVTERIFARLWTRQVINVMLVRGDVSPVLIGLFGETNQLDTPLFSCYQIPVQSRFPRTTGFARRAVDTVQVC